MNSQDKHYQSALATWRAGKETRAIVTPFAFKIDQQLLGMRLAKPWRRALAMLLDLLLVGLLSYVPGVLVAFLAAVATWVLSKRHEQVVSAWARRWLRVISAVVIFVTVLSFVGELTDDKKDDDSGLVSNSNVETLARTGAIVLLAAKLDSCSDSACIDNQIPVLEEQLNAVYAGKPAARNELVNSLFDDIAFLSNQQKQQYVERLLAPKLSSAANSDGAEPTSAVTQDASSASESTPAVLNLNRHDAEKPSLIAWVKGVIADLGLGLSWAALYFTLFTALWRGQTPGKRVLGLRVVRLNGEPLSLWGAFGRYGGYGAGIATGLVGFLQVYWDNNRQCIQDKIGETVVIHQAHGEPVPVHNEPANSASDANVNAASKPTSSPVD
ncbi:RDD family protein [Shewanella mangrovi]|uniref:RDD family protein n=1 Tax=Shewanella mangrovi TaxID=1515746 RepID=UPI00068FD976|nr:RDD family protein [Shewanella mangrovi]